MTVKILYFAVARERAGIDREIIDLPASISTDALLAQLVVAHPQLAELRAALRLAVNLEFVAADATTTTMIHDGDEIALIPPVSGGT